MLYGFAAMNVVRKYGYSVEEFIDLRAVFHKEEELRHPIIRILEKGQDFANGIRDKGLEQAMAFLDNEENSNLVLESGKSIVAYVIKKGIGEKILADYKIDMDSEERDRDIFVLRDAICRYRNG